MSATIYMQADTGTPSYRVGEADRAGHYAVVNLGGHSLRMQTRNADDLDELAIVLMEATSALREAQPIAGAK